MLSCMCKVRSIFVETAHVILPAWLIMVLVIDEHLVCLNEPMYLQQMSFKEDPVLQFFANVQNMKLLCDCGLHMIDI